MVDTKHNRIRGKLRERIVSGQYPVDSSIPGYHQLSAEFGVSYITVSNAVKSLAAEGLLSCRKGVGVFVAPPPSAPPGRTDAQRKVGFIIPKEGGLNLWTDFLTGMLQELDKDKTMVVPVATSEMFDLLSSYEIEAKFQQYVTYGLDSLVICGVRHFPFRHLKRVERSFKQLNFVVYHDSEVDFPEANRILVDFHGLGEQAARRLATAGCNSLVEVTYPLLEEIYAADRGSRLSGHDADILRGVRDYCLANAFEFEKHASVFRSVLLQDCETAALRLAEALKHMATPVGALMVGDNRAQYVYRAAELLGWKVGVELKAIGLYDTLYATTLEPKLSSFGLDGEGIARNTLSALREDWRGKTVLCDATLKERGSG